MPTERCFPPAKTAKGPVAGVRTGRTAETPFGQLAQPGFKIAGPTARPPLKGEDAGQ